MKAIIQESIHVKYDLLLVDEDIRNFPNDNNISASSSMEFVPKLEQYELEKLFKSKAGIHTLYFSYYPDKLIVARECGIDTCLIKPTNYQLLSSYIDKAFTLKNKSLFYV